MKIMGASMALAGLAGCTKQPDEPIYPYVKAPEDLILGKPMYFATAFPFPTGSIPLLVKSDAYRPIKIDALGRGTQLSAGYFSRAFKRSVGCSPQSYISLTRLRRAQDMMLSSDQPLSQIALACGFYDQAHLCKVFRRLASESPNAWRRDRMVPSVEAETQNERAAWG